MRTKLKNVLAGMLTLSLFLTQTLFAYASEINFWTSRNISAISSLKNIYQDKSLSEIHPTTVSPSSLSEILNSPYGSVRSIQTPLHGREKRTVVFIQDIHLNDEAQGNIEKTLSRLMNDKKVDLLMLEGAFGNLGIDNLRNFPYPQATKAVADYLYKNHQVSGAAYAALTSTAHIPRVVGIDHKEHYDANVAAFRASVPLKKNMWKVLAEQEKFLAEDKHRGLNKSLYNFDSKATDYHAGILPLGEYLSLLQSYQADNKDGVDLDLEIFKEALQLEKSLDMNRVRIERDRLLGLLLPRLSQTDLDALQAAAVTHQIGSVPFAELTRTLERLCDRTGISFDKFPLVKSYFQYVLLSDRINAEKILFSAKKLEEAVYTNLITTDAERQMIKKSQGLGLTEKLLEFSLTKDEWEEYVEVTSHAPWAMHSQLKPFEKFYEEAEARDIAISSRVIEELEHHNSRMAVLVTGGFHANGITRSLNQHGIASYTFAPKITKVDDDKGSSYLSFFSQEKTPLERLLQGEKLFVSNPPMPKPKAFQILQIAAALALVQGALIKLAVPFRTILSDVKVSVDNARKTSTLQWARAKLVVTTRANEIKEARLDLGLRPSYRILGGLAAIMIGVACVCFFGWQPSSIPSDGVMLSIAAPFLVVPKNSSDARIKELGQDPVHVKFISDRLRFSKKEMEGFNKKGIFVFDIDKTLAGQNQALWDEMAREIKQLIEAGHLVVIMTGQDMSIQRSRLIGTGQGNVSPEQLLNLPLVIDQKHRHNMVVITNEGSVVHHFDKGGDEYVVDNDITAQWRYSEETFQTAKSAIDQLITGHDEFAINGEPYRPHGVDYQEHTKVNGKEEGVLNRENTQIAFKLDADESRRMELANQVETMLNDNVFRNTGIKFKAEISGKSTISLMLVSAKLGNRSYKTEGFKFLNEEFKRKGVTYEIDEHSPSENGLNFRSMVYFGDEWHSRPHHKSTATKPLPNIIGNDRMIFEDNELADVRLFSVGDELVDDFLTGRKRTTYVGGGPAETLHVLRAIQEEEARSPGISFCDIVNKVSLRVTDWEAVIGHLSAHDLMHLEQMLHPFHFEPTRLKNKLPSIQDLVRFKNILESLRLGPRSLQVFYRRTTGGELIEDYDQFASQLLKYIQNQPQDGFNINVYDLAVESFLPILELLIGEYKDFKDLKELINSAKAIKRPKGLALADLPYKLEVSFQDVRKILTERTLQEGSESSFRTFLFGGRFYRHWLAVREGLPRNLGQKIRERVENSYQGLGGILAFSGGGGTRMWSRVNSLLGINLILQRRNVLPLTVTVPAEDDGAGSGVILFLFEKCFHIKLPAMGDFLNTLSGLSLGEANLLGEPKFPYIFNTLRARFPLEADNVFSQFKYIAHEQVERALTAGATGKELERLISILYEMYTDFQWMDANIRNLGVEANNFYTDLNMMGLGGNSVGNLWYVARAFRMGVFPIREAVAKVHQKDMTPILVNDQKLAELHRSMAATLELPEMQGLPSNTNPGRLFDILTKAQVDVVENKKEEKHALDSDAVIPVSGSNWNIQFSGLEGSITKESGQMTVNIPLDKLEGKTLVIKEQGKEFAYGGETIFGTRLEVSKQGVACSQHRGAAPWGERKNLQLDESISIGLENGEGEGEIFHRIWGGKVTLKKGFLQIQVNRLGYDTECKLIDGTDEAHVKIRNRIVVRQTQITEVPHHFPSHRVGFIDNHKPKATAGILEAIEKAEGAILIGPGSIVTSLIPILLVDEIRTALRVKAKSGIPIIFTMNPYTDNETLKLQLHEIVELIERSVGEKIFGKDGFIQHILVNDWAETDKHNSQLRAMADVETYRAMEALRKAERPRGPVLITESESRILAERGVQLHSDDLMTVIDKEVRGLGVIDGVGFSPRILARRVEQIVLKIYCEQIQNSPITREVLGFFNNNQWIFHSTLEAFKLIKNIPNYSEALALMKDRIAKTTLLTNARMNDDPPDVIVINAAHTLFGSEGPRKNVLEAVIKYLHSGGHLIIASGVSVEIVKRNLFENEVLPIPRELRNQIFFNASKGENLSIGDSSENFWGTDLDKVMQNRPSLSQNQLIEIGKELSGLFQLELDEETVPHGYAMTLRFKAPHITDPNAIQTMNTNVRQNLAPTLHRISKIIGKSIDWDDFWSIESNPFGDVTDIRPYIARLFNDAVSPHYPYEAVPGGRNSIDLVPLVKLPGEGKSVRLSEAAFARLVNSDRFKNSFGRSPFFMFVGRENTNLTRHVDKGLLALLPEFAPDTVLTLANDGARIPTLSISKGLGNQSGSDKERSNTWTSNDVARVFLAAAESRRHYSESAPSHGEWRFLIQFYKGIHRIFASAGHPLIGHLIGHAVLPTVIETGGLVLGLSYMTSSLLHVSTTLQGPFLLILAFWQLVWHMLHGEKAFAATPIKITSFTAAFVMISSLFPSTTGWVAVSASFALAHFLNNLFTPTKEATLAKLAANALLKNAGQLSRPIQEQLLRKTFRDDSLNLGLKSANSEFLSLLPSSNEVNIPLLKTLLRQELKRHKQTQLDLNKAYQWAVGLFTVGLNLPEAAREADDLKGTNLQIIAVDETMAENPGFDLWMRSRLSPLSTNRQRNQTLIVAATKSLRDRIKDLVELKGVNNTVVLEGTNIFRPGDKGGPTTLDLKNLELALEQLADVLFMNGPHSIQLMCPTDIRIISSNSLARESLLWSMAVMFIDQELRAIPLPIGRLNLINAFYEVVAEQA